MRDSVNHKLEHKTTARVASEAGDRYTSKLAYFITYCADFVMCLSTDKWLDRDCVSNIDDSSCHCVVWIGCMAWTLSPR